MAPSCGTQLGSVLHDIRKPCWLLIQHARSFIRVIANVEAKSLRWCLTHRLLAFDSFFGALTAYWEYSRSSRHHGHHGHVTEASATEVASPCVFAFLASSSVEEAKQSLTWFGGYSGKPYGFLEWENLRAKCSIYSMSQCHCVLFVHVSPIAPASRLLMKSRFLPPRLFLLLDELGES